VRTVEKSKPKLPSAAVGLIFGGWLRPKLDAVRFIFDGGLQAAAENKSLLFILFFMINF
jgi:hypothetical protein